MSDKGNSFSFSILNKTPTMKKPQIALLLFLFCTIINAQEFALGIKGGINKYNIGEVLSFGGSFQQGAPNEIFSPNNELNFHFGAFLDISFGDFFVRPEVIFGSINNNYDFPNQTSEWKTSKVDIPILIGYKIFDPVAIYVGPTFSFNQDVTLDGANNEVGASIIPYEESLAHFSIGIQVEFKQFGVDVRYNLPAKEIPTTRNDFNFSEYGVNQADIKAFEPSQVSLSLNIFLFRTDGDDIDGFFSNLFKSNKCWCPK